MAQPTVQQHFYPTHSGPFTPEDREAMPENTRRVALIDGCLLVSPSPGRTHQDLVMELFRQLDAACPAGVTVYPVAFDYRLADGSELVPDITVARREDIGEKRITVPPLLVVDASRCAAAGWTRRSSARRTRRRACRRTGSPTRWLAG